MWIVRLALRRPYTFVVAALVLLLLTPFVLRRTPTDILPAIDVPVVSVVWLYKGLSAQEVEQRIVFNHERMISTQVADIEHTESTSYKGVGVIKVFLQPGTSVDAAIAQITSTSQAAIRTLPPGANPPVIIRYNASSVPVLQYGITSDVLSEQELKDLAQTRIRPALSIVRGVSVPMPYGGKMRLVAVDLDLDALAAKRLSPQDVVAAFHAQNVMLPGGAAKIGATEYDVVLNGNPALLDELNGLPVATVDGATIRVRDVAWVHDGYEPQQNVVRLDGRRGVLLTILKSGTASTLEVVDGVRQAMARIARDLPPEVEVEEFADQSLFVRAAVSGVVEEGVIAALLTATMVLLFLGSWRGTLIITLSIPLSVLAALLALGALGESINLMTLGGLALAVGILVDDATVEIENVHRQMATGKPCVQAILDGAQEIALPAFVSTLCICIVFAPMFFLGGVARFLFVPLALAVVFAVLASYVLSRTLVPTLVLWFYRHAAYRGHLAEARTAARWLLPLILLQLGFERGFARLRLAYRDWLATAIAHRGAVATVFVLFCAGSGLLVPQLGQDFFPAVDAGQFRLHLRARSGTRIEETARLVDEVGAVIRREVPAAELGGILDNIGIPTGGIPLTYVDNGLVGTGDADLLVSLRPGHRPTADHVRRLRLRLADEFPGITFYFLPADIVNQTINLGLSATYDIQIAGRDRERNLAVARRLAERMRQVPGAIDVRIQQPADQPKLHVAVDRTKASVLGLSARDVASELLAGLAGTSQAQPNYWLDARAGVQYPVNIRVPEHAVDSLDALQTLPVGSGRAGVDDGQLLANLAAIRRAGAAPIYSHYDVMPVVDVLAGAGGRDLGGVLRDFGPLVAEAEQQLPKQSRIFLRGQAATMQESYAGLGTGLLLASVLVYLLLVVNFQSWRDPLVVVSALPGALAGTVWALWLTMTTLSVPALVGAIMSLGVATANAVLVVSFARTNLAQGMDPRRAAWEAAAGRLRPVLMTALAMIAGMLPLALAFGEGGEQNAPLGRAVIGGLALATVATLLVVPVTFTFVHRRRLPLPATATI
jgi:multidrug efflux pump subunit AcrB